MTLRCLGCGVFAGALLWPASFVRAEEAEVLAFDATWEWLMVFQQGTAAQRDPVSVDPDFLQTWTTADYNGPAFQPDQAPLSYGTIDLLASGTVPAGTSLITPEQGTRFTVYCRTTFDLPGELTNPKLDFLIDDGFILYVDGVQRFSFNMPAGATSAFTQLASVAGNEQLITSADLSAALPLLSPGRHTLHLSMHNSSVASTDLGFMLSLTGDLRRIFAPTLTSEPTIPSLDGSPRFKLRAQNLDPAVAVTLETSSDLKTWTAAFTSPASSGRSEFAVDVPATDRRQYFRLK
ncbi:MAG TPA: hypothetical protein VG796_14515 [Verrucomicrobiales bacterium]|nr:hypothetical protein [Verrucomicrobiales bacterium]